MYTPEQVSKMLQIPLSTIRRYAILYRDHLSDYATKQHKRRYTEQDITTLARAREFLNSGKSPEQTNELLSVLTPDDNLPDKTLALIPSISQALTQAIDTARTLRSEIDNHEQRLIDTETKLSELTAKLAEIEHKQSNHWYQRLFKRAK